MVTRLLLIGAALTLLVNSGCVPRPKDISDTPRIRELGLVGQCLALQENQPLYQLGPPYRRLRIGERGPVQKSEGGPGSQVGIVRRGTHVRIAKVERATYYDDGWFSAAGAIAFGRIEDGEFAGKLVDLGIGAPAALPSAREIWPPYAVCRAGP